VPCWHIDEGSRPLVGVNIQISLLLERWNHLQGVGHNMMQSLLELQRNHFLKRSTLWNKICMNQANNDYVCQNARIICCKHNIHLSSWWLEKWHRKNICLLVQNIKHVIPSNESKKYLKLHHVWLCVLPHEHNKVGVSMLNLWLNRICIKKDHKPWNGWGPIWCIMKIKFAYTRVKF
jgi:hypothetical protein